MDVPSRVAVAVIDHGAAVAGFSWQRSARLGTWPRAASPSLPHRLGAASPHAHCRLGTPPGMAAAAAVGLHARARRGCAPAKGGTQLRRAALVGAMASLCCGWCPAPPSPSRRLQPPSGKRREGEGKEMKLGFRGGRPTGSFDP